MARGRDRHDARQAALSSLGKDLSRRARNACELCEVRTSLQVVEVVGGPDEPTGDWALMLCVRCREATGPKSRVDPNELRFRETSMWSEVRPVQIEAVRLLRRLDTPWAREALESLYLDPDVEDLL